jgi:archaemetzincin
VIVAVQPIGPVTGSVLDEVEACIDVRLGSRTRRNPDVLDPLAALDGKRLQYSSFTLMRSLSALPRDPSVERVLGITECDLFIPALTFVFGQAQLGGPIALVSACRLRQEFYGMPDDDAVFRQRLRKEVVHELGHTSGLVHCKDFSCAMHLSTNIMQVDTKEDRFCAACARLFLESTGIGGGAQS